MLKTIKRTKQMRLDELIKYVWENSISNKEFKSETSPHVIVTATPLNNVINNGFAIEKNDLFTVEIEEEITEDTEFEFLVEVYKKGKEYFATGYYNYELNDVIDYDTELIYALIDGKLELIYEMKDNNREE